MALLEKQLEIKKSTIPGAGKGLFTKRPILKGAYIVEYTGTITTWKEVDHDEGNNAYIYYVSRKHVIDASKNTKALARYANDARGLQRPKGFRNNSQYINDDGKIYIQAIRDLKPGDEILVSYGKEYWDVIKQNKRLEEKKKKNTTGSKPAKK